MARGARLILVLATALAIANVAWAADPLTAGDLGWLNNNLNLHNDSPALLDLSEVQTFRLHALIADHKTGADRKRQNIVNFLTGIMGNSLEETLDQARQTPAAPTEFGANRPR